MKKIFFGTNLKMYKTNEETIDYLYELCDGLNQINTKYDLQLFVIPSYVALDESVKTIKLKHSNIMIGAQNMNPHEKGQFTGEISPLMLKEIGIKLVMLGHSERRHIMKETDVEINEKAVSALNHQFTTLLCIGETFEQKKYGIADEVLRSQLKIGLHSVEKEQINNLWIAYEPVWAIGNNGVPATSEYANERHNAIKSCLLELFGECASDVPVLYGGSVNKNNSKDLLKQKNIDGLFIGRSAWNAREFSTLISETLMSDD